LSKFAKIPYKIISTKIYIVNILLARWNNCQSGSVLSSLQPLPLGLPKGLRLIQAREIVSDNRPPHVIKPIGLADRIFFHLELDDILARPGFLKIRLAVSPGFNQPAIE
jgi:hypothetical protein